MTAFAEMNQEGMQLMVCQPLANGCEVAFGHLQGKYVVRDMPLVFAVEIMRKTGGAGLGQAADRGGLAFGERFDFGVPLHLAFQAVCHHRSMRGLDQSLVNRLLLPVVAVAELARRMPARKNIVGEVVVQVDEPGRDDPMGIDHSCIRRQLHLGPGGYDFALLNQDGSVLDDAGGSDQGAAQGVAGFRRLRP